MGIFSEDFGCEKGAGRSPLLREIIAKDGELQILNRRVASKFFRGKPRIYRLRSKKGVFVLR